MLTFDIWGSCVTRDALEFILNCNINIYVSRQSIISACSQNISPSEIKRIKLNNNIGGFHKRVITEDIYKTSLRRLNNCSSTNILIIDLIDERNGLLFFDNTYITHSLALREHSNIEFLSKYKIYAFSKKYTELFCNKITLFCNKIKSSIPNDRKYIIIHKAYYSDPTNDKFIKINNTLKLYYSLLEKYLPNAISIEVPCQYRLSSIYHKWGEAPYHYIDEYYLNFIKVMSYKISQQLEIKSNYSAQLREGHNRPSNIGTCPLR